uniref:Uncharacterized protein n=1 Tax=Poecilia reticulata TaxID=8081 RepID=A0A3P9PUA8_POERE
MELADPLFLLMDLPTISVLLVLGKMICWEDYLVRLWHRYSYKHSPSSGSSGYLPRLRTDGLGAGDHVSSVSRTLCGALIFPSIATLVGWLLIRRVTSNLQCAILEVYVKQQQHGNGIYRYYR